MEETFKVGKRTVLKKDTQVVISPGLVQFTNFDDLNDIGVLANFALQILPSMSAGEVEKTIGFVNPEEEKEEE